VATSIRSPRIRFGSDLADIKGTGSRADDQSGCAQSDGAADQGLGIDHQGSVDPSTAPLVALNASTSSGIGPESSAQGVELRRAVQTRSRGGTVETDFIARQLFGYAQGRWGRRGARAGLRRQPVSMVILAPPAGVPRSPVDAGRARAGALIDGLKSHRWRSQCKFSLFDDDADEPTY